MRAHTTAEKAKAVGVALVSGTEAAAKASGVSRRSVQRWVDDPKVARLVAEETDTVKGHLYAGLQLALESVVSSLSDSGASLRDRATALGILFDKWALMSGEVTSRTETRSLTDGYSDDEKRKLRDWIDALDAQGPEGAASDPARVGSEVRQ